MKEDYKEPLSDVSDGSTDVDIESERVQRGERVVLQRISAIDETTAFTRLRFGVGGHGKPIWFSEQDSPGADNWYWEKEPIHLVEGEFLVARFTGTTTGDQLRLHLLGYKETKD